MNDGIIPTAPHRGQIAHYANPNLHKKWTSQLVTDYWGGAQAAAAAGDWVGQDDRSHEAIGQDFGDDARPRTGWSVAPSEYPSTAATSRPRTSATLAATGAEKWHLAAAPAPAFAEQGTAGRGGSGLTEEKLLVVGLMSENEELRRVCGELQDRVEQSLEALKLAAHDVQQVASYARELESGSANRMPRDVMILGDEVGNDNIISTASAHKMRPDAPHHGRQPSRQARHLALPLGGHHQLQQQQQQQGRPGYLTERGMGMAAVAEEGEQEQAIGGYGANESKGKNRGNLTDRGPGWSPRSPPRMGTDRLGTLTPRSSMRGGGRAGNVGARLQTPRLSTSKPRGKAWIPAAAAVAADSAADAARPGTGQTGQHLFRPGTGQSAVSVAASAASRSGEGSGARPGTGRRAAAMGLTAKGDVGGVGGVGGGVSWSRGPRMMARRGSSKAGGGRLGGVEEEERMGAASVLFGGDDIKRERVLSAYSARPGTGASRLSKSIGGRAAPPEGQGRGHEEGKGSEGVSRRMRAMQEEGASIQSRSGLLEATGKQPGDYWWDGRGPGIRRQNNFERRSGHYPVCLAMPACMPDPKPR